MLIDLLFSAGCIQRTMGYQQAWPPALRKVSLDPTYTPYPMIRSLNLDPTYTPYPMIRSLNLDPNYTPYPMIRTLNLDWQRH